MTRFLNRLRLWPSTPAHFWSVGRMVALSGLVGLVAGLGAVAFQAISHLVVHFALGRLAGYVAAGAAGEMHFLGPASPLTGGFSPILLLVVITAGGLLSGTLVYWLAPEAEGHGTDAAIRAYHRNRGLIRPRVPLVKILASAVTIGTGGSGGREGPIAQIGAGFGSLLAVQLKLSAYERRLLLAAGLGAGIAAIFRAPLAGAIFAIEVLYRDEDFEAEALIPAFIASTVAYCLYGLVLQHGFGVASGFTHLFAVQPGLRFDSPMLLAPLTVLAVLMVLAARLYVLSFYGLTGLFKRLPMPRHLRPAVGALASGLVGLAAFFALTGLGRRAQFDALNMLSFGYGILQDVLGGQFAYGTTAAVTVLLVIGLGKILTTSLTIGSGGSGGVFGPSMVIGGTLGGVTGLLLQPWMPATVGRIDVFVILGMASFFSAAAKTPVSTIIIVSELTGGYELLLPAMWVAALSYLLAGRTWTIYREQVPNRVDSPAHRGDFIVDVLKGLTIRGIWKPDAGQVVTVPADMPLEQVLALVPRTVQHVFPVLDPAGRYLGMLGLNDIRQFLYERELGSVAIAGDVAVTNIEPLYLDSDLSRAMGRFARVSYEELPVLESEGSGKVVGLLHRGQVIAEYNSRLTLMRSADVEQG